MKKHNLPLVLAYLLFFLAPSSWADPGPYVGGLYVSSIKDTSGFFATDVMVTDNGNTLIVNSTAHNPITRRDHAISPDLRTYMRNPFAPGFLFKDITYDSSPTDTWRYPDGTYLEITSDGNLLLSKIDFVPSYDRNYTKPGVIQRRKVEDVLTYVGPRQMVVPLVFPSEATISNKYKSLGANCDLAATQTESRSLHRCARYHNEVECQNGMTTQRRPETTSPVNECRVSTVIRITK